VHLSLLQWYVNDWDVLVISVRKKRNVEIDTRKTDDVVWYIKMHVKCVLEDRRIEKAFVDVQWLAGFRVLKTVKELLKAYVKN